MDNKERLHAREIIAKLPEKLRAAKKQKQKLLRIMDYETVGKRNGGWVVDSALECDADKFPVNYLYGAMKMVYRYCQRRGLKTEFLDHNHSSGDTNHCWLTLFVRLRS